MNFKKNKKILLLLLVSVVGSATLVTGGSTLTTNAASIETIKEKAAKFIVHVDNASSNSNLFQDSKIKTDSSKINFNKEEKVKDTLWKMDRYSLENDSYSVETDTNGAPITYIKKSKVTNDALYKQKHSVKASLDSVGTKNITSVANEAVADLKDNNTVFAGTTTLDNGYIEYRWNRVVSGYKFQNDFMIVVMDPNDNSVVSISKRFVSNMPQSIDVACSKEDAQSNAKNFLTSKTKIKLNDIKDINLEIVNPNLQFTGKDDVDFNKDTKLAYVISYNINESKDEFAAVYVDAQTGEIVGGEQTH